jgi:3-hydroxyisobutyrate dehydrogenase-like beta-hydroxyacid dehydrogenase
MGRRIGVIGTGEMGSGVGGALVRHGAEVWTSLAGRSAASAERVCAAGITPVDDLAAIARGCPVVLSIVPPDRGLAVAEAFAAAYAGGNERILYADCNAVAPTTTLRIGEVITAAGLHYVDASIIGQAPRAGHSGPHIYASGPYAEELAELNAFGLEVRPLDGPVGYASAIKMSYAGITKAYTGIAAAMFAAADRSGVGPALRAEFEEHQQALTAWIGRQIPQIEPKAYRWIGEMREIGAFCAGDPVAQIYEGLAQYYEAIAAAQTAKG